MPHMKRIFFKKMIIEHTENTEQHKISNKWIIEIYKWKIPKSMV